MSSLRLIVKCKYDKNNSPLIGVVCAQMRDKCPICNKDNHLLLHILKIKDNEILCCSNCLKNIADRIQTFNAYCNDDFKLYQEKIDKRKEFIAQQRKTK